MVDSKAVFCNLAAKDVVVAADGSDRSDGQTDVLHRSRGSLSLIAVSWEMGMLLVKAGYLAAHECRHGVVEEIERRSVDSSRA